METLQTTIEDNIAKLRDKIGDVAIMVTKAEAMRQQTEAQVQNLINLMTQQSTTMNEKVTQLATTIDTLREDIRVVSNRTNIGEQANRIRIVGANDASEQAQ